MIGSLTKLEELYLNGNQFSGALPAGLSALAALTDLHLHGNQFGAEFPPALAGLTELDSVTIWNNRFTWADSYAPGLLADMVGLVALYESTGGDNWSQRTGWLSDPSVAAWSGVSIGGDGSVTGLDLGENGLSGELTMQLGGLASLTALNLGGNQLEGEIPSTIGNLTGLEELYLNDNQLDGSLPADMGNLTCPDPSAPAFQPDQRQPPRRHRRNGRTGGAAPALQPLQRAGPGGAGQPRQPGGAVAARQPTQRRVARRADQPPELGDGCPSGATIWGGPRPMPPASLPTWLASWPCTSPPPAKAGATAPTGSRPRPVGEWHGVSTGAGGLITGLNLGSNGLERRNPRRNWATCSA